MSEGFHFDVRRIFNSWSKKTEAFFAGVIKESEIMLEWAAEQPTDITTTAIDLEFLPTDANEDRGVLNLEFVLQQMHTTLMALTSYEANDTVANSRKNPLEAWRRLQKRYDPDDRRKKTKPSAHEHFSWTMLSGTPISDRTLGVLRVSLREEDDG